MPPARRLLPLLALLIGLAAALPSAASADFAWLCKPGQTANPCATSLRTTVFTPAAKQVAVQKIHAVSKPKVDCFYVYPTVSDEAAPQASLMLRPEINSIALYQAARYSQLCRVYAPLYRQVTMAGLFNPPTVTPAMRESAYQDVVEAWRSYLANDNRGRGVILIGHSQGTFVLRRLVREEIDANSKVRKRLVSAILLGGNVTVAKGRDVGGDFTKIPACRVATQVRCVIAWSTFGAPVPAEGALFGRTTAPGEEVLCTNPAALGGGSGQLDAIYPRAPFAPGTTIGLGVGLLGLERPPTSSTFLSFPKSYTARCSRADGADVLQITPRGGSPRLVATPTAGWGLHLTDANIGLGNLLRIARKQIAAYTR
jgi:pimeloyl-ACP methyl ester carboxylesterase